MSRTSIRQVGLDKLAVTNNQVVTQVLGMHESRQGRSKAARQGGLAATYTVSLVGFKFALKASRLDWIVLVLIALVTYITTSIFEQRSCINS